LHIDQARPIRVQDASADLRYVVLPAPPEGWDRATDAALATTITPEVLLGVSLPRLG
jgi:nitrile hydratase